MSKASLSLTAEALWDIALRAFRVMRYGIRPLDDAKTGADVLLTHADPKHQLRPDVIRVEAFLFDVFGYSPFSWYVDSKAKRLVLTKVLRARPREASANGKRRSLIL